MKTTNKNVKNESMKIGFNYRLYQYDDLVADDMITIDVSEDEIKKVADVMEQNGGYPVEMCELESLSERVEEEIFYDVLNNLFSEDEEVTGLDVELYEGMPLDLQFAAQKYIKHKSVDVNYYLDVDGKEVKDALYIQITQNAFNKMVEVANSDNHDKADFDILKDYAPEAYKEIAELIFENAYKYSIRIYGEPKPYAMKEFPYQVYENL